MPFFTCVFVFFRLAVVTIGFSQAQYTVQESAGSLNVTCTSFTPGEQEIGAKALVVLQSAEILGLIICFAIHFLCVTIE